MQTIKVTNMPVATTMGPTDVVMVIQGGVNKRIAVSTILGSLDSSSDIRINPAQAAIDFVVSSNGDANIFFVDGTNNRIGIGTNLPNSLLHVDGNVQVGSATTDGVLAQSSEAIIYTSADQTNVVTKSVSPARALSYLTCNTGVSGLFSLSNGANGQVKTICQNTLDAGKTSTISLTGLGFNQIVLDAVGKSTVVQFVSDLNKWVIVGGNGATYSTV